MDLNSDVKLYVISHVPCTFLNSNVIMPIATNKALGDSLGVISSEEGDNLYNLNQYLAEYSTFYWAWKNDVTSKYIGFFHYKRYLMLNDSKVTYDMFKEPAESCGFDDGFVKSIFNDYDIIVPAKQGFGISVYTQYAFCHQIEYLDTALNIIRTKYPTHIEAFTNAMQQTAGYFCNLFVMRREDFNEYMTFIFDIFNEMKAQLFTSPQYKPFAYLGERLFTGYVEYLRTVKKYRVKETPVLYYIGNQCLIKPTTGC